MKKAILPVLAITMLALVLSPGLVMADVGDNLIGDYPTGGGLPSAANSNIWDLLKKVVDWFFNIVILVGALFIVYAGWIYITAGGDDEKAKKGLSGLVQALIGIGIALLAKSLIYVVSTFIINKGTTF